MFIMEKGYFGLGPKDTKIGDEVWVLFGGNVPFVLRAGKGEGEAREMGENAGGHVLIGDSYVHGVMDGEILEGRSKGEKRVILQ
jgi:hypothetical protein